MTSPGQRTSATVAAVNGTSVDVTALGGTMLGLPFPAWYAPQVGDAVVVDWLGSQPYVAECFAGRGQFAFGSYGSGSTYSSPHTGRSTCFPSVVSAGAVPFIAAQTASWAAMGTEVTSAAPAGGLLRVGVYADTGNGYPGALLASPGAMATTGVGVPMVSFAAPLTLQAGLYWLAFQIEGAQATLRSVTNSVSGFAGLPSPSGLATWDGFYSATGWSAGSLPNPFPAGVPGGSNLAFLFLTAQ